MSTINCCCAGFGLTVIGDTRQIDFVPLEAAVTCIVSVRLVGALFNCCGRVRAENLSQCRLIVLLNPPTGP